MDITITGIGAIERLLDTDGMLRAFRLAVETPNGFRTLVVSAAVAKSMCEQFARLSNY